MEHVQGSLLTFKKASLIVAGVMSAALVFAACAPAAQSPSTVEVEDEMSATPMEETSPAGSTAPAENDAQMESGEVKIIEVEAGSFYYNPDEIRVKKGEKVRITMSSVSMMHDFVIDELNVKMPVVQSGSTGTVEFVADQAGTFEYYCSVGQHRTQGQVGKLIVEE